MTGNINSIGIGELDKRGKDSKVSTMNIFENGFEFLPF